jgi:hypothetical protein
MPSRCLHKGFHLGSEECWIATTTPPTISAGASRINKRNSPLRTRPVVPEETL